MELLLFIVIGLVVALPIAVIWLLVRHSVISRRLAELENTVRALERRSATVPSPEAAPQESEIPSPISPLAETPAYPEPSTLSTLIERVHPTTPEEVPPFAQEIPPLWSAYKAEEVSPEPAGMEEAAIQPISEPRKIVDWEKFLGVKLFAWVGGLALFLGIAFFIKYSFEHNLVPPEVRVALGFLTGIGLVVGGLLMRRKEYSVTSQTLCATGIVALYAVSFGAHAVYHLLGSGTVFGLMSLMTVAAFMLAVRMDAKVVAVLGLLGGFLTPPLLSTGQDNPVGLFGYVTLINIGLLAVAFHRRWHFLISLGAIATGIMELGWLLKFFTPEKTWTAITILALFNMVQVVGYFLAERREQSNQHSVIGPVIQSGVTFITAFYFLGVSEMAGRPGAFLVTVLLGNLAFVLLPLKRDDLFRIQSLGGGCTFLALAAWIGTHFREQHLYWALGATLFFAILHSVYPVVLQRRRNIAIPPAWLNVFPLASLGLMMFTLVQLSTVSLMVWPIVFALDLLVIGLAFLTGSLLSAFAAIVLTGLVTMTWIFRIPGDLAGGGAVLLIGLFAVLFFAAGIWLGRKALESIDAGANEPETQMRRYLPAASAILPFLLLALMIVRFDVANPSNIFGLGFLLAIMLLWLGRRINGDELGVVALGASLFLQFFWHLADYRPDQSGIALGWYTAFYGLFMVHPFLFRRELQPRRLPWVASALSGPLHFYLMYQATRDLLPGFGGMGILPALLAIPSIIALVAILKRFEVEEEQRIRLLALFGGSALFFITFVFPVQFSRQWLTLGWALEGAALLWLFRRVPHPGLPMVGVALLCVAFARLVFNPNVFAYYPRSEVPIFNWYLYSYGIATVCLLAGGRLLGALQYRLFGRNVAALLYTLGTILAFVLLNIEIADFFAEGTHLRFQFSGNFARDMTYSIAWALFALGLLLIGIRKNLAPVRYASLGLLGVTLLKLFLHDLSQLGQLYRIGAFIGVAIILILASWFYQRFLAGTTPKSSLQ